jgi:DNA transposition AAA+ family ATPase
MTGGNKMPLPFILIGAAVVAGGTGLFTGARGTMKINEAKEIISKAEKNIMKKNTPWKNQKEIQKMCLKT